MTFTLTGHYPLPNGKPAEGHVEIIPSVKLVVDQDGKEVISGRAKIPLVDGKFSEPLPDPNDPTLNPNGFGYTVVAKLHHTHLPAVSFAVPAGTVTLDISEVTQVDPATFNPGVTYATGQALEEVVERVAELEAAPAPASSWEDLGGKPETFKPDVTDPDLSATYAAVDSLGGGFAPAGLISDVAVGSSPEPFASVSGYVYGGVGSVMHRATDATGTWEAVHDFGGSGTFQGIRDTGDDEVLVVRTYGIYRSTGWAVDPLTATWDLVLAPTGYSWFVNFGVDTDPDSGWAVATTYVSGSGTDFYLPSRYLWLSTDHGQTWAVKRDINAVAPGSAGLTHCHLATLDPHQGGTPSIFFSWHNTADPEALQRVEMSTNGGTSWTTVTDDWQPTTGAATPRGVVFGTDDNTNGILRYTGAGVEFIHIMRRDYSAQLGWPNWISRDRFGNIHHGWVNPPPGIAPAIMSSDGLAASEVYEVAPYDAADVCSIHSVTAHGDKLYAVYQHTTGPSTTRRLLTLTLPLRGIVKPDDGTEGGTAGTMAVADGYGASAGLRGIARGVTATAGEDSVALGYGSDASAPQATAVGSQAATGGGVAVGYQATSEGGSAVGWQAETANGVAVGYQAEAEFNGTAVGFTAKSLPADGSGTALGKGAVVAAGHNRSVAIGQGTQTTGDYQTRIGNADGTYLEIPVLGWAAGNPAAGTGRLWFQVVGGKVALFARMPTGAPIQLAIEP